MTTIRVTRRSRDSSDGVDDPATPSAHAPSGGADFLVVPPETTAATAADAFTAAPDRANRQAPTELLDTLGAADRPDTAETAVRDSDGGHPYR